MSAPSPLRNLNLTMHLAGLYCRGLRPTPTWGQGKARPITDHKALADNPPTPAEALQADYSGGLSIVTGNRDPWGKGFVVGIDVDHGTETWQAWPQGTVYVEHGTAPCKFHIFLVTTNRLEGVRNLYDASGQLIVEVKGYGATALRSFPTRPPDKPKGYTPLYWSEHGPLEPVLSADRLLSGLGRFLNATEHRHGAAPVGRGHAHELLGQTFALHERNTKLLSIAGYLTRHHRAVDVEPLLQAINLAQCQPPLPEKEVTTIAKSALRYPGGPGDAHFRPLPKVQVTIK